VRKREKGEAEGWNFRKKTQEARARAERKGQAKEELSFARPSANLAKMNQFQILDLFP